MKPIIIHRPEYPGYWQTQTDDNDNISIRWVKKDR